MGNQAAPSLRLLSSSTRHTTCSPGPGPAAGETVRTESLSHLGNWTSTHWAHHTIRCLSGYHPISQIRKLGLGEGECPTAPT